MKAIVLLSGGLDSILAAKLIIEQGIELIAVNFVTVFCNCTSHGKTCLASKSASDQLGIELKVFEVSPDYIEVVKAPKHGYGRNVNPCLDCRIFMFKKTKKYMEEIGASFIVTGEVLGSRPMSQRREAMEIIQKESGMDGFIVRPLSAHFFEPSIPEQKGWLDRNKFLKIQGRSRKPQIELADRFGINDYPCPSGGCLLTDDGFARRMRDIMKLKPGFGVDDAKLLKVGRHFRLSPEVKLAVGRDEKENDRLMTLIGEDDLCFMPVEVNGPVGLGRGTFDKDTLNMAARIIARYSDRGDAKSLIVSYKKMSEEGTNNITAEAAEEAELDACRI